MAFSYSLKSSFWELQKNFFLYNKKNAGKKMCFHSLCVVIATASISTARICDGNSDRRRVNQQLVLVSQMSGKECFAWIRFGA